MSPLRIATLGFITEQPHSATIRHTTNPLAVSSSPSRLAAYLASTYGGLVVYATLYPMRGWRDIGVSPFDFLVWEWPRYWSATDLVFNILAYLPLGFLIALLLATRLRQGLAILCTILFCGCLSLGLETLQNWLPGRVPSILDFLSNTLGAGLGAIGVVYAGDRWLHDLTQWQRSALSAIPHAEFGLILVLLWLVCELFPNAVPLGVGDVRYLLGLISPDGFHPRNFQSMTSAVVATNLIAVGLLSSLLLPSHRQRYWMIPKLFALAIVLRSVGHLSNGGPIPDNGVFFWITPAVFNGMAIAIGTLVISLLLPANLRGILAGLALLVATVLVNLTPGDPYSKLATVTGLPTLFFNIQNLAHGLAALWPFLALPYLLFVSRRL